MVDYSHRDRRAHRDVGRAFWAMVAILLGLTGLALVLPLPFVGIAAVVAMSALGAVYLGWSDRLLATYASDLRLADGGGESGGFSRVEASSVVGLDRVAGRPTARSPHVRRRPIGTGSEVPSSAEGPRSVTPTPESPVPPASGS